MSAHNNHSRFRHACAVVALILVASRCNLSQAQFKIEEGEQVKVLFLNSRGFGVSQLGLKGIEVVSTSPPGREGDPSEADRKSEKDQQDARNNRR